MSRFTQTPIWIQPESRKGLEVTGGYSGPGPAGLESAIHIYPPTSGTSYRELAAAIHHEDIHALLDQIAHLSSAFGYIPRSVDPALEQQALEALKRGHRGGIGWREAPAYIGAYRAQEMPGFSEAQRQQWIEQFSRSLDPKAAAIWKRIIDSYEASQRQLPIQAPELR
jgi:hypothetical protein